MQYLEGFRIKPILPEKGGGIPKPEDLNGEALLVQGTVQQNIILVESDLPVALP